MIDSQAPCWSCPPPGCPCPGPCRLSPGSWRPGGPPPSPPPAAGSAGACAAALSPVCPEKQTENNIFSVKRKIFLRIQIFLFLSVQIFFGNSNIFIVRICHLQVCVLIVVHGPPLHHRLLHQMLPERQYRVPVITIIVIIITSSLSLTSEISQEGCAAGSA